MSLVVAITPTIAQGGPQQTVKTAPPHRANEFTLAGLRPGQAKLAQATRLYHAFKVLTETDSQTVWLDACHKQVLAIDFNPEKKIQVIRAGSISWTADCVAVPPSAWKTGRGLRVDDASNKLLELYGPPDSKSPSTRDGQPLELWYYAFDWAGPEVPQVMEVLCTREKEGQPGRVIEITLAAPSL